MIILLFTISIELSTEKTISNMYSEAQKSCWNYSKESTKKCNTDKQELIEEYEEREQEIIELSNERILETKESWKGLLDTCTKNYKDYRNTYNFSGPQNISSEINIAYWNIPHCDNRKFPLGEFKCWVYYNEREMRDSAGFYTWVTSNDGSYKIVSSYEYGKW